MFHLIKPGTKIDFVAKRKIYLGLSIVFILGSLTLLFTKGLNYGIDFSGGAELHIKAPLDNNAGWDTEKLRKVLTDANVKGLKVQDVGEPELREFLVRAQGDEKSINAVTEQIKTTLTKASSENAFEFKRADVVGPAAGSSLRTQGMLSMFYVLIAILIYVAIRFDTRYAPGAVLALFHDTMIVLGVYVITNRQFDLTVLGALLALIGYSNNDTIIVFDRVRETTHMHPEYTIEKAVNVSVNETLGRTIVTSIATFIVAASLWLFGGPVLENFAFMFMIGILIGTYSSIFIASSLVITLTNMKKNQQNKHSGGGGKKRKYTVRAEPSGQQAS